MTQISPSLQLMIDTMADARKLGVIGSKMTDHTLNGTTVHVHGNDLIHFANCGYLGIEIDPRLKKQLLLTQ